VKKINLFKARKPLLIAVIGLAVILPAVFFIYEGCFVPLAQEREKQAVLKAAREFLDAEIRRDYPAVYACFAPSSPYARAHTYDEYLAWAKASADHLADYRIVAVSYIQDNENLDKYPDVEKIAQVEVEATFLNDETKSYSDLNIGFIFFKERGQWYKS